MPVKLESIFLEEPEGELEECCWSRVARAPFQANVLLHPNSRPQIINILNGVYEHK
jgi:hypothetical protein